MEELRLEAIDQANRYADTDTVKRAVGTTQLHKIVVVYKGMDMPDMRRGLIQKRHSHYKRIMQKTDRLTI